MNKKKKIVNKKHRKTKLRLKAIKVSSLANKKKIVKVSKPQIEQGAATENKKTATKKTATKKTATKKTATKKTAAKKTATKKTAAKKVN